jgi:ribosomal protein S7
MVYSLIPLGLTPSGSSTVHIYTNTTQINTMKQNSQNITYITITIHKNNNKSTQFKQLNSTIQNIQPYIKLLKNVTKRL